MEKIPIEQSKQGNSKKSFADELYSLEARANSETPKFSIGTLDSILDFEPDKNLLRNQELLKPSNMDRESLALQYYGKIKGEMLSRLMEKYNTFLESQRYNFKSASNSLEETLDWISRNYSRAGSFRSPKSFVIAQLEDASLRYLLDMENRRQADKKEIIDMVIDFAVKSDLCTDNWRLVSIFSKDSEYSFQKLIELFDQENLTEAKIKKIVIWTASVLGVEKTREEINRRISIAQKSNSLKNSNNLEYARSLITPNDDKEAIINLKEFYQNNIKFEEYKVNEKMNEREVKLLEELISKDQKILEMGCGVGRLIAELAKDGYDISGYDFTKRHMEITKEAIEKTGHVAKVFQGDWHNNAIKNESMDTVYSLGRNILHDYSIINQVQLFRDANRILKKGGQFIFDIPNRWSGGYKKMVDEYASEMEKRGIHNFRYGSIYDSPDGQYFATRYAYSHEDIEELARLTGFKIKKIEKLPLKTGEGDENLYYVLEKI